MKLLLDPVVKTLEDLYRDGFETQTSSGKMHMKVKLMFGVFDLVAKPTVICTKQFNGEFGCPICYHPGKRLPNGARIYLPRDYPLRTHETIIQDGTLAETTGNSVNGIVGISPLAHTINLVDGIPIDDMHCTYEGIVKRLMNLWFESYNHAEPYYLGRNTTVIDRVLMQQHPPHEFSRCPRSISKHLKFWKTSELKNWLLFYSLPLLLDYLPSLYIHHYALLVCAMHILLQESIDSSLLDAAEIMLKDFIVLLPELYGEPNCTANAHMLLHLPIYTRLWGSLWTQSAFGYESKNGDLKRNITARA